MFTGLSAFPLTPLNDDRIDQRAFARLVEKLAAANVDSISVLGSTGAYAYLDRGERHRVATLAVEHAGGVPVVAGVGGLRTRDVLTNVEDAQNAGVSALLLAPMTYQPLTDDEVFGLFEDVIAAASVPIIVYDNPTTTRVDFSDELHARISNLRGVRSIKIPPVDDGQSGPVDQSAVSARIAGLRSLVPDDVTIGISGDGAAVEALLAGADAWYSVLAGLLPEQCIAIARAAIDGRADEARQLSAELQPIWDLFTTFGSFRAVATLAELLGAVSHDNLPKPVRGLNAAGRKRVAEAAAAIGVLPA
ncbi:dihydrodipicolinate synthase family protein [Plantibacter sp. Mn2098]|uniref:dihydrodipicolinate synthase family protein n=1 Tax=Plantibacter sp. Mn2098 TaxID=3395266 RepID=UPI003BE399E1